MSDAGFHFDGSECLWEGEEEGGGALHAGDDAECLDVNGARWSGDMTDISHLHSPTVTDECLTLHSLQATMTEDLHATLNMQLVFVGVVTGKHEEDFAGQLTAI